MLYQSPTHGKVFGNLCAIDPVLHAVLPDVLLQMQCKHSCVCKHKPESTSPRDHGGLFSVGEKHEISNYTKKLSSDSLIKQMRYLFLSGMNLVQLSSLAGLLLLSCFWEVAYFAAPAPGKHLTQHHGLIPSLLLPVGKTMCDTEAKRDNPGTNRKWTLKYKTLRP